MAEHNPDEYRNVKFYAEHTKAKQSGFSKFKVEKEFYFCRYIDGDIAMLSQAYTSEAGRDNGIESVKKNETQSKRYRFLTHGTNAYGFSLKAGNGQEIAISPNYNTQARAEHVSARLSGNTKVKKAASKTVSSKAATPKKSASKPKAKIPAAAKPAVAAFTASDQRIENYRPLSFYKKQGGNADGFNSFEKNGSYYFHYNEGGKIVLISESYTSKRGRDNGIASVTKNMKLKTAYQHHEHKNGKHYFDINAANKQEIATSRWYSTETKALQGAASLRGETTKTRTANVEQNYMPLAFYRNATKGKKTGFESFKGKDGEYYFTYFENDKIALISEGYPTAAIRDKGLASVEKNMKMKSRYVYGKGADGKDGFALRAGNNKEIARSVGYGSAAAATAGAAYLLGTRRRVERKKTKSATAPRAAVAAAGLGASAAAVKPKRIKPKMVKPKTVKPKVVKKAATAKPKPVKKVVAEKPKTTKKKPKRSIAPLAVGGVAVAGLGASAAAAKANAVKTKAVPVKAAAKPKTVKPRPKRKITPLAAGSVAVAGLGASAAAAKASAVKKATVPVKAAPIKAAPVKAPPIKAAPIAAAALGTAAVAGAAAMAAKPKAKPVATVPVAAAVSTPAAAPVAAAASVSAAPVAAAIPAAASAGGAGIWGWLKWVLMGLIALIAILFLWRSCAGGEKVVKATPVATTTKTAAPAAMVTCWNGSKAKNDQACPTKVTCWDDSFAVRQSACPAKAVVKEYTCWDGSMAITESSCPTKPVAVKTPAGTTIANASPRTSVANTTSRNITSPSVEGRVCAPSSNALFNVTTSTPKSVSILGTNPQFGESLSLTPNGFYQKLATAYRTNPSDRAFLNLVARSLGYGSFRDMDASMFSNDTLANGTSGLLGFGSQHALQYSSLNVTDPTNLEAFKVRSANGTDVHFMKRCGNFMYVCQP